MKAYLFHDSEYDEGNAVVVIADDELSAITAAKRAVDGFEVARSVSAANVRVIEDVAVVIIAKSYYRPFLEFVNG